MSMGGFRIGPYQPMITLGRRDSIRIGSSEVLLMFIIDCGSRNWTNGSERCRPQQLRRQMRTAIEVLERSNSAD